MLYGNSYNTKHEVESFRYSGPLCQYTRTQNLINYDLTANLMLSPFMEAKFP